MLNSNKFNKKTEDDKTLLMCSYHNTVESKPCNQGIRAFPAISLPPVASPPPQQTRDINPVNPENPTDAINTHSKEFTSEVEHQHSEHETRIELTKPNRSIKDLIVSKFATRRLLKFTVIGIIAFIFSSLFIL